LSQTDRHPPAPSQSRHQPGEGVVAAGYMVSWTTLFGVPIICMAVAAGGLLGLLDIDAMWIVLTLILAIVFVHAAQCVSDDLPGGNGV